MRLNVKAVANVAGCPEVLRTSNVMAVPFPTAVTGIDDGRRANETGGSGVEVGVKVTVNVVVEVKVAVMVAVTVGVVVAVKVAVEVVV